MSSITPAVFTSVLGLEGKQRLFAKLTANLISYINSQGYEVTFGEAYRTPEQANWDAEHGTGIKNSVHCLRLAVDFNLFKDGKYLPNAVDHKPFGEWWKQQNPLCRWGGDFHILDGNHYSMEHNGVM